MIDPLMTLMTLMPGMAWLLYGVMAVVLCIVMWLENWPWVLSWMVLSFFVSFVILIRTLDFILWILSLAVMLFGGFAVKMVTDRISYDKKRGRITLLPTKL